MSRYRICAIGNSHLAACKLGWDRVKADHPDYRFDFFGFAPPTSSEFERHVAIGDGRWSATTEKVRQGFRLTSGGLTDIEGDAYSAFVTFGMGIGGPTSGRLIYRTHRTPDFAAPATQVISRALLDSYYRDLCSADRCLRPFEALRAISDAPVFLHAIPVPMTDILSAEQFGNDPHCIPGVYTHLRPVFDRVCAEVGQAGLYRYVPQPAETIDPTGLTRPEYVRDGVGFGGFTGTTKRGDYGHGNADYGEIVVRGLIEAFAQARLRAFEPEQPDMAPAAT